LFPTRVSAYSPNVSIFNPFNFPSSDAKKKSSSRTNHEVRYPVILDVTIVKKKFGLDKANRAVEYIYIFRERFQEIASCPGWVHIFEWHAS